MGKILESIRNQGLAGSEFGRENHYMLDGIHGGQQGWSPRLGHIGADGKKYEAWMSNQAHVSRDVIAMLMTYPKAYNFLPNKDVYKKVLKAMIENHTETIEGLNAGINVEVTEHALKGSAEKQEEFTNVTGIRSELVHTLTDKNGLPFTNFILDTVKYTMMDKDTKTALVGLFPEFETTLYTPDYYSFTTLYFEPDITARHVVKAWLTTNMFFSGTLDVLGKRDKEAPGELTQLSLRFGGITVSDRNVCRLAQEHLDRLSNVAVDPVFMPEFIDEIDPGIRDDVAPEGFVNRSH